MKKTRKISSKNGKRNGKQKKETKTCAVKSLAFFLKETILATHKADATHDIVFCTSRGFRFVSFHLFSFHFLGWF